MHAVEHEFALLVVHGRAHRDDAGGALLFQFDDLERRIERVALDYAGEKTRGLFEEGDEGIRDLVRKLPGACGREADDLKPVREQSGIATPAAIFDIVMDRMIVAGDELEGCEIRGIHRTAR